MKVTVGLKPIPLSLLFHGLLVLMVWLLLRNPGRVPEVIDVPIIEVTRPKEVQNLAEVKEEKPKVVLKSVNEPVPLKGTVREVFGASRNTYTDPDAGADGIEAKKGNTLAKEADKTKLEESDADSLPTPTEEYLVSEMPTVLGEVRPTYPPEARTKGLEGAVTLDVLIDQAGRVRQVSVFDGPEVFRNSSIEAMKKFTFRPAKVDGRAVAVRIRYTLKFKLEY